VDPLPSATRANAVCLREDCAPFALRESGCGRIATSVAPTRRTHDKFSLMRVPDQLHLCSTNQELNAWCGSDCTDACRTDSQHRDAVCLYCHAHLLNPVYYYSRVPSSFSNCRRVEFTMLGKLSTFFLYVATRRTYNECSQSFTLVSMTVYARHS
jgi:hypothetical protein